MRIVGLLALVVTIAISIYTAYSFYVGNQAKANKGDKHFKAGSWGIIWQFVAATFASLILFAAFITDDFSFGYVAEHSTTTMSIYYKIAAFWAGHEGSLLLWLWMLTGYNTVLAYINLSKTDRLKSLALHVSNLVQLFLAITIIVATNPFKPALGFAAPTGMGLNPLLMHWAMVLHPPTLFMGYAGLTIPFAFAIAALWMRNTSAEWVERSRIWTLFAWLFLTVGIFLGALWAYVVLGWGGYWAWDPVENASILPWFTGTALLHTFTMYRRRGGMKVWAVALAAFSFIMVIMATFITRSGLIQSVHAFPELRMDLTLLFGGLMIVAGAATWYLINTRQRELETQEFFSDFLSRHFTYYLNNLALVVFTLIILGATVIPPFFKQSVGPAFYNQLAGPLGLLYLLLISVCPYLGWTKTDSNELLKQLAIPAVAAVGGAVLLFPGYSSNLMGYLTLIAAVFAFVAVLQLFYLSARTRAKSRGVGFLSGLGAMFKFNRGMAGGYIGHLGMAVMFFGIAGSMLYVQDVPTTIQNQPGQTLNVSNYQLTFKGLEETRVPGEVVYNASFELKNRNQNKVVGTVTPQYVFHEVQQQQTTRAAIFREPFRDIFVVFNGIDQQGNMSLDIKVNPLISFVWAGSLVLTLGTMIAMWPRRAVAAEEVTEEKTSKKKKASQGKEALAGS